MSKLIFVSIMGFLGFASVSSAIEVGSCYDITVQSYRLPLGSGINFCLLSVDRNSEVELVRVQFSGNEKNCSLYNEFKISVRGHVTTLTSGSQSDGITIYKRTSSPETGEFVLYHGGPSYKYKEISPKKTEQVLRYIKTAKRQNQCG
jgi:hypothetical protein